LFKNFVAKLIPSLAAVFYFFVTGSETSGSFCCVTHLYLQILQAAVVCENKSRKSGKTYISSKTSRLPASLSRRRT
jgi:hypothetical protein